MSKLRSAPGLRDAAAAAGIVAPTPVRSPAGRLIETVRGDNWRVHEWIEVGPSPVTPTPSAVGRQVGSIYGTLHTLAIPSQTPINPYLTARRPHGDWAHLVERATAAGKRWTPQLRDTLPALADIGRSRALHNAALELGDVVRVQAVVATSRLPQPRAHLLGQLAS